MKEQTWGGKKKLIIFYSSTLTKRYWVSSQWLPLDSELYTPMMEGKEKEFRRSEIPSEPG